MSFGIAALAMIGTGAGLSAYGIRQQAKTQEKLYEYNAEVSRKDAAQIRTASLEEQQIQREKMRRHLAEQRAQIAKSGVTYSDSALEAQLRTAEIYAEEIGMMAYSSEIEAGRYESGAYVSRYKASEAQRAGRIGVGTALVGGAASMATLSMEYKLNKDKEIIGQVKHPKAQKEIRRK
jgi:hypothetical protein